MAEELKELLCPRDLALWLGAVEPASASHHRWMRRLGNYMILRDETGLPMFWPLIATNAKTKLVR